MVLARSGLAERGAVNTSPWFEIVVIVLLVIILIVVTGHYSP